MLLPLLDIQFGGARIVKEPQTHSGEAEWKFNHFDGYYWEVAWAPMVEFAENGEMKFKENA